MTLEFELRKPLNLAGKAHYLMVSRNKLSIRLLEIGQNYCQKISGIQIVPNPLLTAIGYAYLSKNGTLAKARNHKEVF
jgi:hypothetical protein